MDVQRRLEVVTRENELLRERVATLERALLETRPLPLEWGLTGSEARVFGALVTREIATKDTIMYALYGDRLDADASVEPKIVDVFVHKLRRKLKPFGVIIQTCWAVGYALDAESRRRFRADPGEGAPTSARAAA